MFVRSSCYGCFTYRFNFELDNKEKRRMNIEYNIYAIELSPYIALIHEVPDVAKNAGMPSTSNQFPS